MTTSYGLTDQGFVAKPLAVIRAEISARIRTRWPTLPLDDSTPDGFLVGIFAERERALWEVLEAVYGSRDPDKAAKAALRALCLITGTVPPPPSYSTVDLLFVGDLATSVDEESKFKVPDTDRVFQTIEAAALAALDLWVAATPYALGDAVTTTDSRAYLCVGAGTSHASVEPTTEANSVPDGTATWRFVGLGAASATARARATVTGATSGVAYAISEIGTPVAGLDAVVNPLDAVPGSAAFEDAELRVLREIELAEAGTGSVRAIRSALAAIVTVTGVSVFANRTDAVDGDGVPPHSVEALVTGGDDQAIREVLFDNVSAGTGFYGNPGGIVAGTITDDEGNVVEVDFSRPVSVPIYVIANITKDPEAYPADGDAQVSAAIVAYGLAQGNGYDAVSRRIGASVFAVPGVIDAEILVGTLPTPTLTTTIAIAKRQRAGYDTSRITVNSIDGVP